MSRQVDKYKSRKSNSAYIVSEEGGHGYIVPEGEAATNRNVLKKCEEVRKGNYDISTTLWVARQLSNEF